MFEKLDFMRTRFAELNELIGKPEIVAKQDEWQKLVKIGRYSTKSLDFL